MVAPFLLCWGANSASELFSDVFNISTYLGKVTRYDGVLDHPLPTYGLEFWLIFLND